MDTTPTRSQYLYGPNSYPSYLNYSSNMTSIQMIPDVHNDVNIGENQFSYQQNGVNNVIIQPVSSNQIPQPIQYHQFYPLPHLPPTSDYIPNNQGNINTIEPKTSYEFKFFYKPPNDFQIYDIFCRDITFGPYNDVQSNNKFVFPFQQPDDKKIYQVTCELIPHISVVQYLNKNVRNIELNLNEQPYVKFSEEHKRNLQLHLEELLIKYLAPSHMCNQNFNYYGNFM
ncbi:16148_t:CDS:1 [Funneliformis mosseae]|uniref:16148_t:CDS:1 n=1 Tax=Funneliformis mosseae TaxID=27381 RepID=A0A9N9EXT7_FUNMO|nr:16148_t:CDS:1 [Funneliformis mosseae]